MAQTSQIVKNQCFFRKKDGTNTLMFFFVCCMNKLQASYESLHESILDSKPKWAIYSYPPVEGFVPSISPVEFIWDVVFNWMLALIVLWLIVSCMIHVLCMLPVCICWMPHQKTCPRFVWGVIGKNVCAINFWVFFHDQNVFVPSLLGHAHPPLQMATPLETGGWIVPSTLKRV